MKTQVAPKSTARPIPTAEEQAAALAKLSQKDRDTLQRQSANAAAKGKAALAETWQRLAGVAAALTTRPPKFTGLNTVQFFIADGNYRKQVYAMHLSDVGVLTLYLPNILPEAIKAKQIIPLPKDPAANAYATGKDAERVVIEPLDRDSLNPQSYFKDMTGWNRKAIGMILPADAGEGLIHTAEQLMALAAIWPAAVIELAK
jgi:hypothetical protein